MNNRCKTRLFFTGLLLAVALVGSALLHAQELPDENATKEYTHDITLTGEPKLEGKPAASSPLSVDAQGNQTNLKLETPSRLSPYIGAVRQTETPDDLRHLLGNEAKGPLGGYRLETGIGVDINDKAGFNLGYRLNNPPTTLDPYGLETDGQAGHLRFGLDFKIPFK